MIGPGFHGRPIHPINADGDADGWGDAATTLIQCEPPSGYVTNARDCDDADPAVHPGAVETCDGLDNDCSGIVDHPSTWYADTDGDGWGDPESTTISCAAPTGFVANDGDCDDDNAGTFPGSPETCDGVDNDCNGVVDDDTAIGAPTWYADTDADGFGDLMSIRLSCTPPSGFVADATDCDDTRSSVHPGAVETCDGLDNDCNGLVDDDTVDVLTWYAEADADGYGDPSSSVPSCAPVSSRVTDASDCDDTNASVNPAAAETCNGFDDNCDGVVDTDAVDAPTWYRDADNDGYGNASMSETSCGPLVGYIANATDCDDTDDSVWPGALEVAGDGVDQDCDGEDAVGTDTGDPKGGWTCATTGENSFPANLLVLVAMTLLRRMYRGLDSRPCTSGYAPRMGRFFNATGPCEPERRISDMKALRGGRPPPSGTGREWVR